MTSGIVLLSGGLDSAGLLGFLRDSVDLVTLFVDYGQPGAKYEEQAASRIASDMEVRLRKLSVGPLNFEPKEIVGRNSLLAHLALLVSPDASFVAMAIHAGTPYVDCSPAFAEVIQASFDLHTGGTLRFLVPFIHWPKSAVQRLAVSSGISVAATYSCDKGLMPPCRSCLSCSDNEALNGWAR